MATVYETSFSTNFSTIQRWYILALLSAPYQVWKKRFTEIWVYSPIRPSRRISFRIYITTMNMDMDDPMEGKSKLPKVAKVGETAQIL